MNPILESIVKEIVGNVPVEAIILVGSRAKGISSKQSDYDVVVVMKTPLVPIYILSLKKINEDLTAKHGVKIEVNPLPTFRARRAKGNLFLLKLKREGELIYGKDYIKLINPGDPKDMVIDWYFSYLASSMKKLIAPYDPITIRGKPSNILNKVERSLFGLAQLVNGEIGNTIRRHANIILKVSFQNTAKSWFDARDSLLDLFQTFIFSFSGNHYDNINKYVEKFLKMNKGKNILKNLEYAALLLLIRGEPPPIKAVFSRTLVQDRLRASLTLLLASVKEGGVDEGLTHKAYCILKDYFKVKTSTDPITLWRNVKEVIFSYWSLGHTVMGF